MKYNKIHCLFEQSGTFKNVFKSLGYDAFDYDIENNFSETDFVLDLFEEIDNCYNYKKSIFDNFSSDDLIFAFFPCIRFENQILLWFRGDCKSQKKWSIEKKLEYDINIHNSLNLMYSTISKLVIVAKRKNLKLIIENPYSEQHYLIKYWCLKPSVIDLNRKLLGDYYKKPTQYFFINLEPLNNELNEIIISSITKTHNHTNPGIKRSLISKEYALNFVKKYILGSDLIE